MPADTTFKIHLLRAPDYDPVEYFDLCKILQSLPMPGWEFILAEKESFPEDSPYHQEGRRQPKDVHFDYFSPVHKLMYQAGRGYPLSWQELFGICKYYRRSNAIPDQHFIVLLTNRPNALNWFSAFDDSRHIFIHTDGWELFMKCPHQYPVAYEVIANVLQSQMRLDVEGKDACLHTETIGCMNDFCVEKRDVTLKLRTGDICVACAERLKQCEVSDFLVSSALQGFEAMRIQMMFTQGFKRSGGVGVLEVSWLYEFRFASLGSLPVQFSPMERVLYAFFLKNPGGIQRVHLMQYREKLLQIYGRINGNEADVQKERIDRLINPLEGSFNEKRTRINDKLKKSLGFKMARPYLINGDRGGVYKVAVAGQEGMVNFEEDLFD